MVEELQVWDGLVDGEDAVELEAGACASDEEENALLPGGVGDTPVGDRSETWSTENCSDARHLRWWTSASTTGRNLRLRPGARTHGQGRRRELGEHMRSTKSSAGVRWNKARFEMSMMGELKYFLGFEIKQLRQGSFINQAKYLQDMLKRFDMKGANGIGTPMHLKCQLNLDENGKAVDHKLYRFMIGKPPYGGEENLPIFG
ncbi:hypothetical protein QYE76_046766 [Lolium multiflorum]|uniref:Reverse transcriptase Ty1/copia-type domain-containing protein n=1 Tax=Lolium multiflorum TaxID=4521 RepID=A0AAD8TQ46_LOLMU|nr:hypothetical protein QYE76_046766 [Lolium multiflorum]